MNNHLDIKIEYHTENEVDYRIVGVTVEPSSVKSTDPKQPICDSTEQLQINNEMNVAFTYSVEWIVSFNVNVLAF